MIGIVVSRADPVSERIGEQLLSVGDWTARDERDRTDADGGGRVFRTEGFELRTFEDLHLSLDGAAETFSDPEFVVFVSRHAGDTGPLLTAHVTGSFGSAEHGGRDGELAEACPNAQAAVLDALAERAPPGYDVGLECTHHGPSDVGAPGMFVELGSDEAQWDDDAAASAVARAVLDLRGVPARRDRQLVGFGGGHYVPRFARIVRETPWAVGHVGADWALDEMGDPAAHRDVLRQAFERSGADRAVVDGDRPGLEAVVEELGYRVVSETWVREVGDASLELVATVEERLGPVDDGVRLGAAAADHEGSFAVVDLPAALRDEALGVDAERARAAVDEHAIAYETEEAGTRPGDRMAVADPGVRDAVVDAFAALLAETHDAVEREDGAVVARQTEFVPALARERGVEEGPAFGRLANGEPVTVDGETVRPDDVTEVRHHRFPV